jgi:hypothetical protein
VLVPAAVLVKLIAAGRAVGTDTGMLYAPSPAALRALTTKSYSWPPVRLVAVQDLLKDAARSHARVTFTLLLSPSLPYTLYPVTAEPVVTMGAAHDRVIDVVVCVTDATVVGAGGVVDAATTSLAVPMPAELSATTTHLISTPLLRLVSTAEVAVLSVPSYTGEPEVAPS